MNDKLKVSGLVVVLFTATLSLYWSAFDGDFQYDDSLSILQNPHLDRLDIFIGHLDHMVRPMLYATFLLDRSLYGANAAGYHVLNLLLHLGSGLLIYRILSIAVRDERSSVPFWTALVFLIHPIATETVTYISGRASGLMAYFYLLSLLLYIKASEPSAGKALSRLYLSGAAASFVLSIGAKETAVTLPIILLLWDALIRRLNGPDLRSAILSRHSPFWIVLLIASAWAWSHPRYSALAQFSFNIRPFWTHLLSQIHVVAYGTSLIFTPWSQNFDHDLPLFHSLAEWSLPLELCLLAVVAAGAFLWAKRLPLVTCGLAWFYVQLLPTLLIPRNDLLSERNLYLPAMGLLLASVALGPHLIQRLLTIVRRPAVLRFGTSVVGMLLVAALCFFTYQRNLLYQDRLLLWADAARKSPNKARPHNNLGYAYSLHGDWDRAVEEFRTAAQLDPDFTLAQENLRDAYLHRMGRR